MQLAARQAYDPNTLWILSGVALRMGQRLSLHNESGPDEVSPFDREMRRRLWWQLLLTDGRTAQLTGSPDLNIHHNMKFQLPTNLDDADISPDMTEIPVAHKGATEMLFCLLRYEFGAFMVTNNRKLLSPTLSLDEKDRLIDEFETHLECTYLRYCDPAQPVHLLASGGSRSAICKMRLVAHHPSQYPDKGAGMDKSERDMLFATSIKMVEYDIIGQSTRSVEKFAWHMDAFFQLDAFVFMLIESQNQAPGPSVDRAWQLVSDTYNCRPAMRDDDSNELYVEVMKLTLRSWKAREANLAEHSRPPVPVPPIITQLRAKFSPKRSAATEGNEDIYPWENTGLENVDPAAGHPFIGAGHGGMASSAAFADEFGHGGNDDLYLVGLDDGASAYQNMDWDQWNLLLAGNPYPNWSGNFDSTNK
jgi:hypothetical protein